MEDQNESLPQLWKTAEAPSTLLSAISGREASLWLHRMPDGATPEEVASLIGLPWREVYVGESSAALLEALRRVDDSELVRRRGFVQLIQTDPTLLPLPPRSLPVYVLDGSPLSESQFDRSVRRIAMLGVLRRSGVRNLVVLSDEDAGPPPELAAMVDAQFRPFVTFVSATELGDAAAAEWAGSGAGAAPSQLVRSSPADFARSLVARYAAIYPSTAVMVRFRGIDGSTTLVDLTDVDDPERPILANYELLQERDLAPIQMGDLTEEEFASFFEGRHDTWRAFAAGLPWQRDRDAPRALTRLLGRLDSTGSPDNKIAFIASEPGSGGTTLARTLAMYAARAGYPTLVARPVPFSPDPLPIAGYLTRAHQASHMVPGGGEPRALYETPWVIVFDRNHFDRREGELRHFLGEMTKSGRPVIVVAVTGPQKPLEFYSSVAQEVAAVSHILDPKDAVALGDHLNMFLRGFDKARSADEWRRFHQEHGVGQMHGIAAFWIALSFWLRTSRDITGTIQEWIYESFLDFGGSLAMQKALVEIAALSSERLPMQEDLLPPSDDRWPLAHRLEDQRRNLGALGLVTVRTDGVRFWGLAHDILGRLLLNALFYDFEKRSELGFAEARDPEHLRFLALRQIALKPAMSEVRHRVLADQFATLIFKIDPDHGQRAFAPFWREVLSTMDEMPKLLWDTSRVFRHHTAISRRRIATLDGRLYGISPQDKLELLERAIEDITFALDSIDRVPGEEPDLNLYNSLANACLNLADAEADVGGPRDRIALLRQQASEATHRAYSDNPTNPWVVETHIKNLLSIAKAEPERAVESALEALLAIYDALRTASGDMRAVQLGRKGEEALDILFAQSPPTGTMREPETPLEVLIATWRILSESGIVALDDTLADLPPEAAARALRTLESPAGRGDIQVLRLRYGIVSASRRFSFGERLALVENLQASDGRLSPQLKLEYALLLYQVGRFGEGDRAFRNLRELWRSGEHFVRVTEPLNWLHDGESDVLLSVQAHVSSDQGYRPLARVSDFRNALVPFRPEEFGVRTMRPGMSFRANVSFGHNGPFLRPPTAGPRRD